MKVSILGVGNLLLGDEGIGVHTVNALLRDYCIPDAVEVIDGGTLGMELLAFIAEAEHLILLDAVKTKHSPGTVIRLDDDEVPAFFSTKLSPHQVGLSDVLAAVYLTGEQPNHVTLFGVEPANMNFGLELSDKLVPQVTYLIELVIKELDKLGFQLKKKL